MAYSETSGEEVDLDNPNLDAALHQAEQLLGIPPDQARFVASDAVYICYVFIRYLLPMLHLECSEQDYGYDVGLQPAGQVSDCGSDASLPQMLHDTLPITKHAPDLVWCFVSRLTLSSPGVVHSTKLTM